MPISPQTGESQSEWMGRCVPEMMGTNGGTERPQEQAVGICLQLWRDSHPSRRGDKAAERWSVGASRNLPIAETERAWDGSGAAGRMLDRANIGEDGTADAAMARRGFLIYDAANSDLRGSYSCPFADIVDGQLKAIPSGLRAAASRLPQVTGVSDEVRSRARGVLDGYFARMEEKQISPQTGESQTEWMDRCIPTMMDENDSSQEQAIAQCSRLWRDSHPSRRHKAESQADFMARCIENMTGADKPEDQATAVCLRIWRDEETKPQTAESQSSFMDRCVPAAMNDGAPQEQAIAMCLATWREEQPAARQAPDPDPDESRADFMDRCLESDDEAACALAWNERRARGVRHRTHAAPVAGMEFVLSDETPDRMGDIISSTGWDLANFQKNPIALFNHNSDFPIGKWQNLRAENGALRGHLQIAPEGTSARIDEIRRLIDAGILKAVSVGFQPTEHKPREIDGRYEGQHFLKQELIETSLVSVPANPNALAIAKSLRISDGTLKLVFAEPGNRNGTIRHRRFTGEPAEISRTRKGRAMPSLAQRIVDSQARLVALRDELTDHLKTVDDSNVSDAQLEITQEFNARIAQEEKGLASLKEAERRLAASSGDPQLPSRQQNGRSARPFNIPAKKIKPIDYVVYAGTAQLLAHCRKISVEAARQGLAQLYPHYDDEGTKTFCEFVTKAATAPAMTTVTGWAAELVTEIHGEFMEMLLPQSVYPQLAALGLSLSFGRAGRIAIPTRSRTPTIAGSFVGEGQPIPVRQGAFTAQVLTPKKMAVITTWTREIDEHSIPAIEGLLRNAIQEDTAISLDSILLDAMPATVIRPPGLLNGITALAATAGGGFNALVADLKQLSGALLTATLGNVRVMAWLMNPQQVLSISLTAMPGMGAFPFKDEVSGGRLLTYPIIKSATVPMGTVIAIDAADFVSVGGEAPRFEVSDQATLHMDDTTPLPLVDGASTAAAPVRSLWQTDSLALRLILPMNWGMRRAGMVAWIQGVTW